MFESIQGEDFIDIYSSFFPNQRGWYILFYNEGSKITISTYIFKEFAQTYQKYFI